jgi:CubicO group peptidase (beta-lactamase class C family)
MVAKERAGNRGDPEEETAAWLGRLADVERKRGKFQDMAAEGPITFDDVLRHRAGAPRSFRRRGDEREWVRRDSGNFYGRYYSIPHDRELAAIAAVFRICG